MLSVEQLATSSKLEVVAQMTMSYSKENLQRLLQNEANRYALVLDSILQAHGIGYTTEVSSCSS